MQLRQIYSNRDAIFAPIRFNGGSDAHILNVIYATVMQRKARDRDSHNLGKTTLIHLIDFLLLKDIAGGNHFFAKHSDRFAGFAFFLEIQLHGGGFVTVRRSVSNASKVALVRSNVGNMSFHDLTEENWEHWNIPLSTARNLLDAYLDLRAIKPWDYRKGVSYFLRSQEDYADFFQIRKFMLGKDREWKPYLAKVLGLDHEAVQSKYALDEEIETLVRQRDQKRTEVQPQNIDRGQLVTKIEILRDEIEQIDERLDDFNFSREERRVSRRLVEHVEARIAEVNLELYDLDADIAELERSIRGGIKFDLRRIREIFEESEVAFSNAVARSYEDLIAFNQKLTRERNSALRARIRELVEERQELAEEHERLNGERQRLFEVVKNADTFKTYKALQKELAARNRYKPVRRAYLQEAVVRAV